MEDVAIFDSLIKKMEEDQGPLATWSKNYFRIHRPRYTYDMGIVKQYHQTGTILEVGSAPYHLTFLLQQKGYDIKGIDIAPERQAKFIAATDLDIVKCNIEQEALPFPDNSFHYIIFNEIFEHLRINPIQTLKEVNRVLHPDGVMVLTTPNLYGVRNVINFLLGKGFDNPYEQFLKLETIQHMGHVREYSIGQVKEFLEKTGYESIAVQRKSHLSLTGMWRPFNWIRKVFPGLHAFQVHICKKAAPKK